MLLRLPRRTANTVRIVGMTCGILAMSALTSVEASAQPMVVTVDGNNLGSIPDGGGMPACQNPGAARDVTFAVAGIGGTIQAVEVTMSFGSPTHTWAGDIVATLIAPNGAQHDLFGYTGAVIAGGCGDSSDLSGPYTFSDLAAGTNWWTAASIAGAAAAIPSGTYGTTQRGGAGVSNPAPVTSMNAAFSAVPNPNGLWRLRLTDGGSGDTGAVTSANIRFTWQPPITTAQPATALFASSVSGQQVTLRWTPPLLGPAPTGYVLEGGVSPGHVLATVHTGSASPIYTFTAPSGSFYVRLHTVSGGSVSGPSNELLLHVNVPVAPSPPTGLVGLVDGSSVALAWTNTFAGGAPTSLIMEVFGLASASIPLGLSDTFGFAGVPDGTYTIRLRAVNAGGISSASNEVTLTFPGPCSGAPSPPINFLVHRIGSTIHALWDPSASGPAPTTFILNVSGTLVGSLPLTARQVSGTVGPGSYGLSVAAANTCGVSPPTPVQMATIP